jgi:hypothetical protein
MIIFRTSCGSISTISCAIIPAHREAEEINLCETEGADKQDCVRRHLFYRGRRCAAGGANASIVERDDVTARREPINHARVPVVQDGSQVDEEYHRRAGIVRPELPIDELHSTCGDRSSWHVRPIDRQILRGTHIALPSR